MSTSRYFDSNQANETISKFKLLSAYGGAGSIIHTSYGSILISCIEEWGFLEKIKKLHNDAIELNSNDIERYVQDQAKLLSIGISNDSRLIKALKNRKNMTELQYLVLIPNIEVKEFSNKIKKDSELAINSSFMPKVFSNRARQYKFYKQWYDEWIIKNKENDPYANKFFPPKYKNEKGYTDVLTQDNIVLICEHGHISDFPWSQFLKWRTEEPLGILSEVPVDLFTYQYCCGTENKPTSKIKITSSTANASGFDGKWLSCETCRKQISLRGLMSLKIKCPGQKPWESDTGDLRYYSGSKNSRDKHPPTEICVTSKPLKVALTTGNNLYFSRLLSSIYMPDELFLHPVDLEIKTLEKDLEDAKQRNEFEVAIQINNKIKELKAEVIEVLNNEFIDDNEKEVLYRYDEFIALTERSESEINIDKVREHLKVKDVTDNLNDNLKKYFSRVLRLDNIKVTTAQLDFSRVEPADADSSNIKPKNIFRKNPESIQVYPVVENYGEGIFFALDKSMLQSYLESANLINLINTKLEFLNNNADSFSEKAIKHGLQNNWQLYLVHTLSHLVMRELEFKCGYPTASLSERLYVSNEEKHAMHGFMIYTSEGAEGSMGGLIAQTSALNLNSLITSALKRATICNSDPLCWESEGQGLFELNFASCFSCSLVSETSCEHRNIYLDRRILVDEEGGFFREMTNI